MPRRGNVPKREVLPDPMYGSVLVTKLVNSVMLDGKKGVAQKVVYAAFDQIKEKTEKDPVEVFQQALENVMPSLEVKARRVGGANYQVPMEVRPARRQTLALRWLTAYSRSRSERTMAERLAGELMDAANNTGASVKKREEMHKQAEANKRSRTSVGKARSKIVCQEKHRLKTFVISVSWRTSMPVRPPRPSVFCTTPA